MGLKFLCHHCEHPMHVKDFLAGKRGKCPQCGGSIRIPAQGEEYSLPISAETKEADGRKQSDSDVKGLTPQHTSVSASDIAVPAVSQPTATLAMPEVIAEAPNAAWYVRPPSGGQYGPAIGPVFWDWLNEKRVGENSLVWREGWGTWQTAKEVFPDFFRAQNRTAQTTPPPIAKTPLQPVAAAVTLAAASSAVTTTPPATTSTTSRTLDSQTLELGGIDSTAEARRSVQIRRKKGHSKNLLLLVSLSAVAVLLVVALIAVLVIQNNG